MKTAQYRPPAREEIPSVPKGVEWIDALLAPRDSALKEHSQALQRRLTFSDNVNCEVRTLSLQHNTEVTLTLGRLKGAPLGVLVLWSGHYDYARVAWEPADASRIRVKVKWDSTPTGAVDVTLLIVGS